MNYKHTLTGIFLRRPNRFLAHVFVTLPSGGEEVVCHVKNTGRLKELLVPGAAVVLEYHPDAASKGRRTSYSLIGIYKEHAGFSDERLLVNIDSQAPNQAAYEWVAMAGENDGASASQTFGQGDFLHKVTDVRREVVYGNSRFDLAFTVDGQPAFMEVKGVTLEFGGTAMFPDAPTERGVKHIQELQSAVGNGFAAYLLFVIQMKGVQSFAPNKKTHVAFAEALRTAAAAGVRILARDCIVTENSMRIDGRVGVML